MKDEKKRISENSIKLPKEWEHPPKNLKGKDVGRFISNIILTLIREEVFIYFLVNNFFFVNILGMWYREREKKVKLLKKTELVDDAEKRLSKKEKKDLKVIFGIKYYFH